MKLLKDKKGEGDAGLSIQQILFYAAEIAVGVTILVFALMLSMGSVKHAESKLVATDVAFTIQTISSYPYAMYFAYTADMTTGALNIKKDSVRVDLEQGHHTKELKIIKGINVQEKYFFKEYEIPIIRLDNQIVFDSEEVKEMVCEKFYRYPEGQRFYIEYESNNNDELNKLKLLEEGINMLYEQDFEAKENNLIITHRDRDAQKIKISFNQEINETIIKYDSTKHEHETFSCHALKELSKPQYLIISKPIMQTFNEDNIELRLPSINRLNYYLKNNFYEEHRNSLNIKSEIGLMQNYAIMMYDLLKEITEKK